MADRLCELNLASRCRSTVARLAAPVRAALGVDANHGGSVSVDRAIGAATDAGASIREVGEGIKQDAAALKSRLTPGGSGGRGGGGGGGASTITITLFPEVREQLRDVWASTAPYHDALFAAVIGAALYCALGGRWMSIAPSDVRSFGAFARPNVGSLPATMSYATEAQRAKIAAMGRRFGCHTCGVRRPRAGGLGSPFIADHQPPIKIARAANRRLWRRITGWEVRQQFLPQCASCSQVQAAAVKNLKSTGFDGRVVAHHATTRLYHLTGGLLVALACGADRAVAEAGGGEPGGGLGLGAGGSAESGRHQEGHTHGVVK